MPLASSSAPLSFRPAGTLDVRTALEPYRGPWSPRLAAHLLRRAGFGGTPADVARLAARPMNAAVDALVRFPSTASLPPAPGDLVDEVALRRDLFAQAGLPLPGQAKAAAGPPNAQDAATRQDIMRQLGMARRRSIVALQTWWLERMLATPAPLQEKMTLFWHGHFTSAIFEKGTTPQEILAQNELFRTNALGNIRALTLAVAQDPAMLKFLDNRTNVKAHPNENFARELMELFTLGHGNYTEQDVRESARAFTGWMLRGPAMGGGFVFNPRQHDDGLKTFLGRTGDFDGGDVIAIIFQQPAAAQWFARKLLGFFVYSDPEPELIDAVAAQLRKSDFELAPVMSTLLRSNVFYSERAYRALVKSPVEYVVGTYALLGLTQIPPATLAALGRMSQILFVPPDVKGWDGGSAWLNSQTVLARENLASALVNAPQVGAPEQWVAGGAAFDPHATAAKLVATILAGDASPNAVAQLEDYLSGAGTSALGMLNAENFEERVRTAAYLTMAMPAYQLA